MSHAKRPRGFRPVSSVNLIHILESTGIQMALIAKDLVVTDKAYGTDWSLSTGYQLASLSELLSIVLKQNRDVLTGVEVTLPEGWSMKSVPNPLFIPESEEPQSYDSGSSADREGDDTIVGDFPF